MYRMIPVGTGMQVIPTDRITTSAGSVSWRPLPKLARLVGKIVTFLARRAAMRPLFFLCGFLG